jgi:hypothetical protein
LFALNHEVVGIHDVHGLFSPSPTSSLIKSVFVNPLEGLLYGLAIPSSIIKDSFFNIPLQRQ